MSTLPYPDIYGGCPCYRCWADRQKDSETGLGFMVMNLCPTCGNKRCPAANDHKIWACNGSNEPGQSTRLRDATGGSDA